MLCSAAQYILLQKQQFQSPCRGHPMSLSGGSLICPEEEYSQSGLYSGTPQAAEGMSMGQGRTVGCKFNCADCRLCSPFPLGSRLGWWGLRPDTRQLDSCIQPVICHAVSHMPAGSQGTQSINKNNNIRDTLKPS